MPLPGISWWVWDISRETAGAYMSGVSLQTMHRCPHWISISHVSPAYQNYMKHHNTHRGPIQGVSFEYTLQQPKALSPLLHHIPQTDGKTQYVSTQHFHDHHLYSQRTMKHMNIPLHSSCWYVWDIWQGQPEVECRQWYQGTTTTTSFYSIVLVIKNTIL